MQLPPKKRTLNPTYWPHGLLRRWHGNRLSAATFAIVTLFALTLPRPAVAATSIALTAGETEAQGTTGGSFSFLQLAARDRHRKLCLGYGTSDPDYVLELTEAYPHLRIAVDSNGGDTTLLIQGPRGIDCNDNYRRDHRDAAVTDENWPTGTYRIWVGAFNQGEQLDYRLRVFDPESLRDRP